MPNIIKELFLREQISNKNVFSTGFKDLDNCIKNVKAGSIITIAGRPAIGKTEFTLSVINNLLTDNKKVVWFNLDLNQDYFVNRLIANKTNLHIKDIFEKNFDIETIRQDLDFYEDKGLMIENEYDLTVDRFEQKLNRNNTDVAVIDYIQLLKNDNSKTDIIREIKRIAIEKNITIIVLSQVSRRVEYRDNKYPLLADLKTFNTLEELSDIVLMIYRDDYYNHGSNVLPYSQIIIRKNLFGECTYIKLSYSNGHFRNIISSAF